MTMTHTEAQSLMQRARSQTAGKPIQNNTRLFASSDDGYAIRYHGTFIVTINPDGTFTLANGGWNTSTTLERIRSYSPAKLFSERHEWYLRLQPNPKDPQPERFDRTIPKPYTIEDPGPEPVKTTTGWTSRADAARDDMTCIAGRREHHEKLVHTHHFANLDTVDDNTVLVKQWYEVEPFDGMLSASARAKQPKRLYDTGYSEKKVELVKFGVFYGEKGNHWNYDDSWQEFTGQPAYQTRSSAEVDGYRWEFRQCPHCEQFDKLHRRWSEITNGSGWGARHGLGFAKMTAMLDQFGSMEAWHDAYLADFRARKVYLKAEREWDQRNRVPFYDGVVIDSDGYALRLRATGPSPAKLRRHERAVEKMKKRIDKFVKLAVKTLEAGMPMPSGGDCWYCLLKDEHGKTWGDMGNHDHLLVHMDDKYIVPSLLTNAMLESGAQPVGVYMWLDMDQDSMTMGGKGNYDIVARNLRKYMNKRLIPAAPTS